MEYVSVKLSQLSCAELLVSFLVLVAVLVADAPVAAFCEPVVNLPSVMRYVSDTRIGVDIAGADAKTSRAIRGKLLMFYWNYIVNFITFNL